HLASCEHCQTALANARRQQRLLAAAAKTAFPNVQFQRPTLAPTQVDGALAKKARLPRFHFALAATILMAMGIGLPVAWFGWRANELQGRLAQQESALAQARNVQTALVQEKELEFAKIQASLHSSDNAVAKLQQSSKGSLPSSANASPTGS